MGIKKHGKYVLIQRIKKYSAMCGVVTLNFKYGLIDLHKDVKTYSKIPRGITNKSQQHNQ